MPNTVQVDDWREYNEHVAAADLYERRFADAMQAMQALDAIDLSCDCEECRPRPVDPQPIYREEIATPNAVATSPGVNIETPPSIYLSYYVREDILFTLRQKDPAQEHPVPSFRIVTPELPDYASVLRAAFSFFRQHGNRRYSDTTLMRLMRAADQVEMGGPSSQHMPEVALAAVPFTFDEETETKTGGVAAMLVHLGDGRCILAVHNGSRRRRLGVVMLNYLVPCITSMPVLWVHQQNTEAQHFLLNSGFFPTAINSSGAIRYARSNEDD